MPDPGAMSWDDILPGDADNDVTDFTLLPEGEYWAQVQRYEQDWCKNETKDCPQAVVVLIARDEEGHASLIFDRITLHDSLLWRTRQFFKALGLGKEGEDFKGRWDLVKGCPCKVKLGINNYNPDKPRNQVNKYITTEEIPPAWTNVVVKDYKKKDPAYVIQQDELPEDEAPF